VAGPTRRRVANALLFWVGYLSRSRRTARHGRRIDTQPLSHSPFWQHPKCGTAALGTFRLHGPLSCHDGVAAARKRRQRGLNYSAASRRADTADLASLSWVAAASSRDCRRACVVTTSANVRRRRASSRCSVAEWAKAAAFKSASTFYQRPRALNMAAATAQRPSA
jgi:hypothetical protein